MERLTRRELEVLALVATGTSNAEASRRLNVSLATIKSHLTNTYRKLGTNNRVEATRLYLGHHDDTRLPPGLLPTEQATTPEAQPPLLPEQIDRHLETLATVADETERLRRRLNALRATSDPAAPTPRDPPRVSRDRPRTPHAGTQPHRHRTRHR
jgi:DNA-binding CsgD family transcriptional regulator